MTADDTPDHEPVDLEIGASKGQPDRCVDRDQLVAERRQRDWLNVEAALAVYLKPLEEALDALEAGVVASELGMTSPSRPQCRRF